MTALSFVLSSMGAVLPATGGHRRSERRQRAIGDPTSPVLAAEMSVQCRRKVGAPLPASGQRLLPLRALPSMSLLFGSVGLAVGFLLGALLSHHLGWQWSDRTQSGNMVEVGMGRGMILACTLATLGAMVGAIAGPF
jgi:hypothetical protein